MIHPVPKPKAKPKAQGVSLKRGKPLKQKTRMKQRNAKRKGHMFPKNVDEPYRAWIRSLPCFVWTGCVGRKWGWTEAAHVKTRGSGGTDRNNLVPLCHAHHAEQHAVGIRQFEQRHGLSLRTVARQLTEVYEAEKFPCPMSIDSVGASLPGAVPWRYVKYEIEQVSYMHYVERDVDGTGVPYSGELRRYTFDTEAEALAVRDALNGVAPFPDPKERQK